MSIPKIKKFVKGDRVYVRAQQVWVVLVAFVMSKPERSQRTMNYGDLATKMGMDSRAGIGLGRELGIVGYFCVQNGLPAINNIVVNRETGVPGVGVVTRKCKTIRHEQVDSFKTDWFEFRVPTTGTFRLVWEWMNS